MYCFEMLHGVKTRFTFQEENEAPFFLINCQLYSNTLAKWMHFWFAVSRTSASAEPFPSHAFPRCFGSKKISRLPTVSIIAMGVSLQQQLTTATCKWRRIATPLQLPRVMYLGHLSSYHLLAGLDDAEPASGCLVAAHAFMLASDVENHLQNLHLDTTHTTGGLMH